MAIKSPVIPTCMSRVCACRKPAPGMLLEAARDWQIDLPRSYMVGDNEKDVTLIKQLGGKGILVGDGYGELSPPFSSEPDYRARDVLEALMWILTDVSHEHPHR